MSIEDAGLLLRRRQLSPVELTDACLDRISRLNPKLNAFITVTAEQALAAAHAAEKELSAGRVRSPLHGVPIAFKDLLDTAGIRTTAGSKHYTDRVPEADADVVARLKSAGAIVLGKLNMDEFAYNYTSETSFFGPCHNPWALDRSPGGSSGASGVAVASGLCFGALGSDTGGSIRLPAAVCGITGLKPSYGRVSTVGAAPLAWSLDHVGPMCRSARDASLMLQVMEGKPGERSFSQGPPWAINRAVKGVRLGAVRKLFFEGLDPEVSAAVEAALKQLAGLTAGVRDVELAEPARAAELPFFYDAYLQIISAESFAFHEKMLKQSPELYHPLTRKNLEGGAGVTAAAYINARREMDRLRANSRSLFAEADLLITPAAPVAAFPLGKPESLVALRNAAPWNLYGLPSVSIPCGFTKAGLPVGLQITGGDGEDRLVLALAHAYQQATDWHTRRPAL